MAPRGTVQRCAVFGFALVALAWAVVASGAGFRGESVGDFQIAVYFSPDENVVWTELWIIDLASGEMRRLGEEEGLAQTVPGGLEEEVLIHTVRMGHEGEFRLILDYETDGGEIYSEAVTVYAEAVASFIMPLGFSERILSFKHLECDYTPPAGGPTPEYEDVHLGVTKCDAGCRVSYHSGQSICVQFLVDGEGSVGYTLHKSGTSSIVLSGGSLQRGDLERGAIRSVDAAIEGACGSSLLTLVTTVGEFASSVCECELWVRDTCDFVEDFETGLVGPWVTAGHCGWTIDKDIRYSGLKSARSVALGGESDLHHDDFNDKESVLALGLSSDTGGTVSFMFRVESERRCDYGAFLIDGVLVGGTWHGTEWRNWTRFSVDIGPGLHLLEFIYSKDSSGWYGADAMWIDDFRFECR